MKRIVVAAAAIAFAAVGCGVEQQEASSQLAAGDGSLAQASAQYAETLRYRVNYLGRNLEGSVTIQDDGRAQLRLTGLDVNRAGNVLIELLEGNAAKYRGVISGVTITSGRAEQRQLELEQVVSASSAPQSSQTVAGSGEAGAEDLELSAGSAYCGRGGKFGRGDFFQGEFFGDEFFGFDQGRFGKNGRFGKGRFGGGFDGFFNDRFDGGFGGRITQGELIIDLTVPGLQEFPKSLED